MIQQVRCYFKFNLVLPIYLRGKVNGLASWTLCTHTHSTKQQVQQKFEYSSDSHLSLKLTTRKTCQGFGFVYEFRGSLGV